jgi:hypothetical protein
MKTQIDSNQKKLPFSVIVSNAILTRYPVETKKTAKDFLVVEKLMTEPNTETMQVNNTVFIVRIREEKQACLIIPFNMDTEENYVKNIIGVITNLIEKGIKRGVFMDVPVANGGFGVYRTIKEQINVPTGISQTGNRLTFIWDSSISLKGKDK